jgi:NADH-quinone oxidoreductase subunit L
MALHRFLKEGWGFDWLYTNAVVRPYVWAARINRNDFLDGWSSGVAQACQTYHRALSVSVNGNVRWYVGAIAVGSVLVLAFVIFS